MSDPLKVGWLSSMGNGDLKRPRLVPIYKTSPSAMEVYPVPYSLSVP